MKQSPKWKFSSLTDFSAIFTQIYPNLPIHTKRAKIKPIPETGPFKYPNWKFASEIDLFVILPKLTQNFFNFKISQIKISKISKIKIHISEKHP